MIDVGKYYDCTHGAVKDYLIRNNLIPPIFPKGYWLIRKKYNFTHEQTIQKIENTKNYIPKCKWIDPELFKLIKKDLNNGMRSCDIARKYNIPSYRVGRIKRGSYDLNNAKFKRYQ
jgi:hypothetical protein